MILLFGWIILGIVGLGLGTNFIMDSAFVIAKRYNLSHTFVGVAFLAVVTDLPEVFVTLEASVMKLQGIESSGIITGNAIGSCFSQITLVLGVAGLFLRFTMAKEVLIRDGIVLLGTLILIYFFGEDGKINRFEGGLMLLVYALYYLVIIKSHVNHNDDNSKGKDYSNWQLILLVLAGFVLLAISSNLLIEKSMQLAELWGVAQSFVGVVIVGIGTSLPELAVTIVAVFRKSVGMTVGNIIGSNIFDGLIPIGLGGVISNVKIERNLLDIDLPILFVTTLIVLLFLWTKRGIGTLKGTILVAVFCVYLAVKFITI